MKYRFITCLLLLAVSATAGELPRRAFLGIVMEPLNDDARKATGFTGPHGVLIARIIPGSTAEAAGFARGDILLSLGNTATGSPAEAVAIMRQYHEGQTLAYKISRKGKIIDRSTTVKGMAREHFKGIETTYGSVQSGANHLRTIFSKPAGKTGLPAILFIQGVGCYSMDTPNDTLRPEYQLLNHLVRNGYAVMRVDKPGQGDSHGIPCESLDFNTELDCYKAAFAALQQHPDIDPHNLFIIGHSMGGVMAPLLAQHFNVKGIIAYGTMGVNFMEYYTLSRRTITQAYGMAPTEADAYVKQQCACASLIISAQMSKTEVEKYDRACAAIHDDFLFRAKPFWYQLNEKNLPAAWQQYKGHVLAAWGEADYISTRQEHEYIAQVVNAAHPGNATFKAIPRSSHGFTQAAGFTEAVQQQENGTETYNPAAAGIFLQWLSEKIMARP